MKLPKILKPRRSSDELGSSRSSSPSSSPALKSKRSFSLPSPKSPNPLNASFSSSPMEMELEQVFNRFDSNRDGQISISELGDVLRSLGESPTHEELVAMIAEVDGDGDGLISLQEFIRFNGQTGDHDAELRAAFHVFDLDQNGFISAAELHKVLMAIGEKITMEDCGRMIRGVDSNGDGHVDFEEFKVMMAYTEVKV